MIAMRRDLRAVDKLQPKSKVGGVIECFGPVRFDPVAFQRGDSVVYHSKIGLSVTGPLSTDVILLLRRDGMRRLRASGIPSNAKASAAHRDNRARRREAARHAPADVFAPSGARRGCRPTSPSCQSGASVVEGLVLTLAWLLVRSAADRPIISRLLAQ